MSSARPSTVRLLVATFAATTLAFAGTAAAADPDVACTQAVAKSVAKCVKKVLSVQSKCFKDTGSACASNDENLVKATTSLKKGINGKCENTAAVQDAGYGPLTPAQLANHFADHCVLHGELVTDRALAPDGSRYTGADDDEKKCLLNTIKVAGKFLSKSVGGLSKCFEDGCDFDFSAEAAEAATDAADKCDDFPGLVGTTAAVFMTSTAEQIPSAVASPCDPSDTGRCLFPYPNDRYTLPAAATSSGRRINIGRSAVITSGSPTPVNATRWNEADGFSVGPMILFQNTSIDLAQSGATPITDLAQTYAPNQSALLIDAETGERQLFWLERDVRGATVADQAILGHVGRNLKNGHRYIVALRNMKDSMGATVPASAAFAAYRDNTPTTDLPFEAYRAHMEDIFSILTGYGITRSELFLAWDFTTQSVESTTSRMLTMRDDALDILGSDSPAFTVNSVTEPLDAAIFRRVDGTFQVPLYMEDGGAVGCLMRQDENGVPYNEGDFFTASFRCIIPYAATTGGAAPAIPARPSLYGHGLLGSHTEVTAGNVRDMANEHNFVFCATDWTGFASADQLTVAQVVGDFQYFPKFIDRQHQGMLNQIFLGRLMMHPDGFASHTAFQVGGNSVIDNSELFYDGNSQGGILGGVLAAISPDIERFSLGVPGINYSILLYRSVDFVEFDDLLKVPYPAATDRNLLLSLAQNIWDRTDPNGHVAHTLADNYPDTPPKKVLYQVAFGDHQVAPVTAEIAARTNGAKIHTPVVSMSKVLPEVDPYYDIDPIPAYPYDGSALVVWDSGNPAPPITNFYPEEITPIDAEWMDLGACPQANGSDPHSCPRKNPDAREQKSEFLKTGGAVTDVCMGGPCWAN